MATVADIIAADQLAGKLAAANLVSIEQYLHSTYEPDADYVDGIIEERCPGEWDHSSWQGAVLAWFEAHAKDWNIRTRPGLRMRTGATRFRIPDVSVFDRDQVIEQVPTRAPMAIFEVLSPEDQMPRVMKRLADFASMGVPEIWLLDPETKIFSRFANDVLTEATHYGAPGDRIHFKLGEIEAYLD